MPTPTSAKSRDYVAALTTIIQGTDFDSLMVDSRFLKSDGLYEAAVDTFKEASAILKKKNDPKAMERLVRAYSILQHSEVSSSPAAKPRSKIRKFASEHLIFGKLRAHNKKLQEAEKIFTSHFEAYLRARHESHLSKNLEEALLDHTPRIEAMLKTFGIKSSAWDKVKQDLAKNRTFQAVTDWHKILSDIRKQCPQLLKTNKEVESFLLGNLPLQHLLKPDNAEMARFFSQIPAIEKRVAGNPKLEKEWEQVQVALLRNKSKLFKNSLKSLIKKTKDRDLYKILFHPYRGTPALPTQPGTGPVRAPSYETILSSLSTNNAFGHVVNTAKKYALKLDKPDSIDLSHIALDKNNYIATAAPQKQNVDAYFDALERSNTRVIVDLKDDFEAGMNKFTLLPAQKSGTVSHGNTTITLVDKKEISIPGTLDDTQYITRSTIQVTRDGKTKEYEVLQLHHWEKEDPPDLVSLRTLHQKVEKAKQKYKSDIAVQCVDGRDRTSTFLFYHHFMSQTQSLPLKTYVEYSQFRPATSNPRQFAAAFAAIVEERTVRENRTLQAAPLTHPMEKFVGSPTGKIAALLCERTSLFNAAKALIANSKEVRDRLKSKTNSEIDTPLLNQLVEQRLENFLEGLSKGERQRLLQEISHMQPFELNFILYLALSGKNYKKFVKRMEKNVNLEGHSPLSILARDNRDLLFSLYPSFYQYNPIDVLLRKQTTEGANKFDRDLQVLHNLENARQNAEKGGSKTAGQADEEILANTLQKYKNQFLAAHLTGMDAYHHAVRLNPADRQSFGENLIYALPNHAFREMGKAFVDSLTPEQLRAISSEQAKNLKPAVCEHLLLNKLSELDSRLIENLKLVLLMDLDNRNNIQQHLRILRQLDNLRGVAYKAKLDTGTRENAEKYDLVESCFQQYREMFCRRYFGQKAENYRNALLIDNNDDLKLLGPHLVPSIHPQAFKYLGVLLDHLSNDQLKLITAEQARQLPIDVWRRLLATGKWKQLSPAVLRTIPEEIITAKWLIEIGDRTALDVLKNRIVPPRMAEEYIELHTPLRPVDSDTHLHSLLQWRGLMGTTEKQRRKIMEESAAAFNEQGALIQQSAYPQLIRALHQTVKLLDYLAFTEHGKPIYPEGTLLWNERAEHKEENCLDSLMSLRDAIFDNNISPDSTQISQLENIAETLLDYFNKYRAGDAAELLNIIASIQQKFNLKMGKLASGIF